MGILDQIANPQMADIAGALDYRQKRLDADEAKRKEIRLGQLISEALPHFKDGSAIKEIAINNPREFHAITKSLGIPTNAGERMQEFIDDTAMLYTLAQDDPRRAFEYAMDLSEERKAQGRETAQIDRFIAGMREDAPRTMTGLFTVHRSLNPEKQDAEPSDVTKFKFITKDMTPEQIKQAKEVEAGLRPRAVGSADITTATTGLTDAVAVSKGVIKDATKRAEGEAENATKTSKEYFDQVQNIRGNIANYQEGIRLLREDGANTGVIERRLPSLKAASQKLDNLRNRLGLDVVSGTTFGALSEAELEMALDTGMPSNLQPAELASWFESRMAAQTKLADILDGAIQFLAVPGNTLADLRQEQKANQGGSGQGATTTGITGNTEAKKVVNWGDL